MNRMAVMSFVLLAATAVGAVAQEETGGQAPKPTLADVQRLADAISSDKSKLEAYCKLGRLHDDTQQAVEDSNLEAVEALAAKTDALEQKLGPEYDKVIDGLDQVDLNSTEGQTLADVFKTLQEKCN
jgi:hypothetical protein